MALLCPLNNLFQPLEKASPYTDTEYQVAAMAVAAGLFVIVAMLRKGNLCVNVTRPDVMRRVLSAARIGFVPVRSVRVDTSPPLLIPLRI